MSAFSRFRRRSALRGMETGRSAGPRGNPKPWHVAAPWTSDTAFGDGAFPKSARCRLTSGYKKKGNKCSAIPDSNLKSRFVEPRDCRGCTRMKPVSAEAFHGAVPTLRKIDHEMSDGSGKAR